MRITISDEIKEACPGFVGMAVYAKVENTKYNEELWKEIDEFTKELLSTSKLGDIKNYPTIAATREADKRCGKDPARYRPSAEA